MVARSADRAGIADGFPDGIADGNASGVVTGASAALPTGMLAVVSAAALCASFLLSPAEAANGPVVCPFRLATGLPCPGCGLTRAWVFLAHGRVADAVSANPFVLVTMPAAAVLVLVVLGALVRRRPAPDLSSVARSRVAKTVVVVWLGFAVVRLLVVLSGRLAG